MTLSDWAAALIVLAAALLTVITGFGFVVLSAPLLAYLYDPLHTVYLSVLLSTLLLGILLAGREIRRVMRWGLVLRLSLWGVLGLPLGLLVVPHLDKNQFRLALGVITLAYVAFRLWGGHLRLGHPRLSVALAGILGGAFSTSSGMSALPVIFLAGDMQLDAFEHRATLAGYVFFTGITSLAAFHLAGTAQTLQLQEAAVLGPALLVGMLGGTALIRRLSERQLAVGVLIYLAVNGVIALLPV
ncbi:MAG: sulfite exporter TauE/SafE family protein [Litorilinea sp.]